MKGGEYEENKTKTEEKETDGVLIRPSQTIRYERVAESADL